jgi:hypothetical protein
VFGLEMKRAVMDLLAVWIFQSSHVYVRLVFFFCPRLSLAQDPCVICCWCSFILCLLVPQMPILAKDYGPGVTIGDKIEGVLKDYNGLLFYFIFFIFFPSPSIFFSSSPVFPLFSLMFSVFSFFFFLIVAFLWLL